MNVQFLNTAFLRTYGPSLLISVISLALGLSPLARLYPEMILGIMVDLILVSPLLVLLISRKTRFSSRTALPFLLWGIVISYFLFPTHPLATGLNSLKNVLLPLFELGILITVFIGITKGIKRVKQEVDHQKDEVSEIRKSVQNRFGNNAFSTFLTLEIVTLYYALFAWKIKKSKDRTFTLYENSGQIGLVLGIALIMAVEGVVLHILLMRWNPIAAWIVTGLELYSVLYLIAHVKALFLRPSIFTDNALILKNGLLGEIHIPLNQIEYFSTKADKKNTSNDLKTWGNLGLTRNSTEYNILLFFKSPLEIKRIIGKNEMVSCLYLTIDQLDEFKAVLKTRLNNRL